MRCRTGRALAGAAAAATACLAVLGTGAPALGQQQVCTSFTAVGGSDGVRTAGRVPGFLLVEGADGSRSSAQAFVNSRGTSTAYAGAVYSDAVAGNIGVIGADPNSAPLIATSSHPSQPEAAQGTPAASVRAKSEEAASSAEALAGVGDPAAGTTGRSVASGSASCDASGRVVATGAGTSEALSFGGGVLRLSEVRTEAKAVAAPDGRTVTSSSITITGAQVLGQAVSITEKGIVVAGSTVPTPSNPLSEALEDAGITVRVVAGSKDTDGTGVVSPAVEVTLAQALPVGSDKSTVVQTFGASYARARSLPGQAAPAPEVGGAVGVTTSAPDTEVPTTEEPVEGSVAAPPPELDIGSVPPSTTDAAPTTPPAPEAARSGDVSSTPVASALLLGGPLATLYPAIAFGALVVVLATLLFRIGAAPTWT